MYRLSIFVFMLPLLLLQVGLGPVEPLSRVYMADDTSSDTCRVVTEYLYTRKVLEGMVCHDRRDGVWREWYPDGRLKDSAVYKSGVRIYSSASLAHPKGVLHFRGNPRQFYKDSTYECSVSVDTYHGVHDIRGDYEGVSDTIYPPLFYFGADMGTRDSFNYYFTPRSAGKYKLRISLTGGAVASAGAPFCERDIVVLSK